MKGKATDTDKYCIVRCDSAGVFAAKIAARRGHEADLVDARRIWYWDGAASLSQLAMEGSASPNRASSPWWSRQ